MFVQGKEVRPAKNWSRQCIDLARVGLAVEVWQSELPLVARNPLLPQISSHFPLRVRQPFWREGKICCNQSNSTQRTPTAARRWERPINPTEGGENHFFFNHAFLPLGKLSTLKMRPALICYALLFRQNIKINQGRNDYREWLVVTNNLFR